MTRTYASIREALASGILDQPADAPSSSSNSNASRRSSVSSSSTSRSTSGCLGRSTSHSHVSQSFTSGAMRRPSYQPDRRRSSHNFDLSRPCAQASQEGGAPGIIAIREIRLHGSPPPEEDVDLSDMSPEDLDRLKREDPFAYHSIPQVRRRSYRFEGGLSEDILREVLQEDDDAMEQDDVGAAEEAAGAAAQVPPPGHRTRRRRSSVRQVQRHRASMPAGMLADAELARMAFEGGSETSSLVSKRSRLSCEAHPSLVCEDLYAGGLMGVEEDGDEDEDRLMRLMAGAADRMEE